MPYDVDRAPAEWLDDQVRRRSRSIWLLLAGMALLVAAVSYVGIVRRQLFLELVLLVPLVAIGRRANANLNVFPRWLSGAQAERSVGDVLNELRSNAFHVMHDIPQAGEGNIDHLVSCQNGVFMIETKLRRYELPQLRKAKRQAAKLHDELGVWVTPVICIAVRKAGKPFKTQGVWIVRRDDLARWIREQRNQVLPFDRLAQFADKCE